MIYLNAVDIIDWLEFNFIYVKNEKTDKLVYEIIQKCERDANEQARKIIKINPILTK